MYFSKLCRFTKVIRSFSFSVKISLEAQTAPAFMYLNSFSFCTSVMHEQQSSQSLTWLLEVCKGCPNLTHSTNTVMQPETHTHQTCLQVYLCEVNSYWKPILAIWVKGSGSAPSALSDGSYSV